MMVRWIIIPLSFDLKTFPIIRHTTDLIRAPWEKERSTTLMYMSIVRHIPISEMFKKHKKKNGSQNLENTVSDTSKLVKYGCVNFSISFHSQNEIDLYLDGPDQLPGHSQPSHSYFEVWRPWFWLHHCCLINIYH